MFKPEIFRKQMCCLEKALVTLLGLFGAPCSHSALPIVIQLPPGVIWRPHSGSAPEKLFHVCPLVTPLRISDCLYTDNGPASADQFKQ